MTSHRLRYISFVALGLISVLGIFLILQATPEGLGLSDDSIAYIAGARSLLAGQGYREAWLVSNQPVTHFPPGFPAALALIGLSGLDPLRGARFLNALLYGLNAALLGILGWRMTKSLPAGLILALLFVANSAMLQVHAVAMSEPLFIFFSLAAFWMFDLYFERDQHWLWLVLCGVFTGAAYLTRYAGLALLATFVVALIILQRSWRSRLMSLGLYIVSVIPWMAGWAVRNEAVAGKATNRILAWHPIQAGNFDTAISNIAAFLMPIEAWRQALLKVPFLFEALTALILGAVLVWILIKIRETWMPVPSPSPSEGASRQGRVIAFTNALYIFGYLASIIASMSFFDASTKFKLRILAPIFVSLLILLVALGIWLWGRRREVVIAALIVIIGLSVVGQVATVSEWMKGGQGFASFIWYRSKAMAYLRELPASVKIYTDQPGAVYLYTGRGTYTLPDRFDPVTAEARPGFQQGVNQMQGQINAGRAVLALFSGGDTPDADAVILKNGLYLAFKGSGAEIYSAAP